MPDRVTGRVGKKICGSRARCFSRSLRRFECRKKCKFATGEPGRCDGPDDRGPDGGAAALLCEGAHELVAGELDILGRLEARGCEGELVRADWSRASEVAAGLA